MQNERENKYIYYLFVICILEVYVLPKNLLDSFGFMLHTAIFAGYILLSYIIILCRSKTIGVCELMLLVGIIFNIFIRRQINSIILLTPIIVNRCVRKNDLNYIVKIMLNSKWIDFALFMIVLYSLYGYFIEKNRFFISSAIGEENFTGISIIILALIYYKRNHFLAYIVFGIGFLTLSRNYILAVICIVIFNNKSIKKAIKKIYKKVSFFIVLVISSGLLYILGLVSIRLYKLGVIAFYTSLKDRLHNFFDLSNYARFTTNYFYIQSILNSPIKLFTGQSMNEFQKAALQIAKKDGVIYRGNGLHNYALSYLMNYGIAAVFCFIITSKVIKNYTTEHNFYIFVVLSLYAIFLGAGPAGYWLVLFVFLMILYQHGEHEYKMAK